MKIHGGIEFNNEEHGEAISRLISASYNPPLDQVISRTIDGTLAGGVLYQKYIVGGMIEMHAGAWDARWLSKEMRWVIFAYPFLQLKVKLILVAVGSGNARSLKLCRGLGFVDEHVLADAVPDGDIVLLSMRKSGCRWLKGPAPKGFVRGLGDGHG